MLISTNSQVSSQRVSLGEPVLPIKLFLYVWLSAAPGSESSRVILSVGAVARWGDGSAGGCNLRLPRESGVSGDVGRVVRRTGRGRPEYSLTLCLMCSRI